jgi:hypothetical protein
VMVEGNCGHRVLEWQDREGKRIVGDQSLGRVEIRLWATPLGEGGWATIDASTGWAAAPLPVAASCDKMVTAVVRKGLTALWAGCWGPGSDKEAGSERCKQWGRGGVVRKAAGCRPACLPGPTAGHPAWRSRACSSPNSSQEVRFLSSRSAGRMSWQEPMLRHANLVTLSPLHLSCTYDPGNRGNGRDGARGVMTKTLLTQELTAFTTMTVLTVDQGAVEVEQDCLQVEQCGHQGLPPCGLFHKEAVTLASPGG